MPPTPTRLTSTDCPRVASADRRQVKAAAVVGASGFVGQGVTKALRARGMLVTEVSAPRMQGDRSDLLQQAQEWRDANPELFGALVDQLRGVAVVVNAAGIALPEGRATQELFGGNSVLPVLLAMAAASAGVGRFVQVSSAAVQGRLDPLDESSTLAPVTPYGWSKALGERGLLSGHGPAPPEVVIYRATSVQDARRGITRRLVGTLDRLPAAPVVKGVDAPLPVTLLDNVAAGVAHIVVDGIDAPIVLHPWEGITTRLLLDLAGVRRLLPMPKAGARALLAGLYRFRWNPTLPATARRLELFWFGQRVQATALAGAGFTPPAGLDCFKELVTRIRACNDEVPALAELR